MGRCTRLAARQMIDNVVCSDAGSDEQLSLNLTSGGKVGNQTNTTHLQTWLGNMFIQLTINTIFLEQYMDESMKNAACTSIL